MKKFFKKLILILPVFVVLSGCAKNSGVDGDKMVAEGKILKKASKEVQEVCGYYYACDSQIVIDNGEYYGVPCLYYKAKPIDFDNCSKESVRKLRGDFTDDGNFLEPKVFEEGGKKYLTADFFPERKFWIKDEKTIVDTETNTEYIKGEPK
ncbi:hypothetical protein [uncultured Parvimonas sp.]|uniref:hypothetical protein n=1 Tax=uncultured Parvimonas sp. TaxID=747372 RepID=UPI00259A1DDF|nr:hypothetical protein [uncultured Parvimonas sp.]